MVGEQRPPRDRRDHLSPTDDGPAERMGAEDRFGGEIVDEILRIVVHHRDLLEHDLALRVDVDQCRREHHVRHHVEGDVDVVVGHPRVDDGRLARGGGVELAAHRVEQLGDADGVVPFRALEQQVLDEVRHAGLGDRLVARAGADPEADRRGADTVDALGDDTLAAGKGCRLVRFHRLHPNCGYGCTRLGTRTVAPIQHARERHDDRVAPVRPTREPTGSMTRHRLSRDHVIWSFGPDLEPVLEVVPGDVVTFETNDCFSGQIKSEADLVTEIDLNRINSATGPVAVRGAEPGDSLVAEILDIRPVEWGVATLIPGFGQLDSRVHAPLTRLFEVRDGIVRMNERVSFPAAPMVGVVGVATASEMLRTGLAGHHGGNLDDHWHAKGARIFFPVQQPGGMLAVGDMHASMGDGEICFTGVEIAGEVDIRFNVLKGKQATWPVTELHDRWVPHATATDYADALQLVSEEAAKLLVDEHGFTIEDAFIFLSVACDAGVAQACKPAEGFGTIARFSIPKIDACPRPFRA